MDNAQQQPVFFPPPEWESPRLAPPTPLQGWVTFLAAGVVAVLLSLVAILVYPLLAGRPFDPEDPLALLQIGLVGQAAMGLVALAAPALCGAAFGATLGLRRIGLLAVVLGAVGILCFSVGADWVMQAMQRLLPGHTGTMGAIQEALGRLQGPALWLTIVSFAAVPAVCEELLFRGFLYRAFARRWGPWPAVLLTSLLFGLMHLDPVQGPAAVVAGLFLGGLRVASGGVVAPMVAHAVNNLVAVVLLVTSHSTTIFQPSPALVLVGFVVGAGCLALVAKLSQADPAG